MILSQIHLNSPLWSFINARVADNRYEEEKAPPASFPEADYWLLASCLQKAIRRGDLTSARRAGHQLLHTDEKRLWRRLVVIALEDIGIGDIEVAIQMIALATKPRWREEFGGDAAVLDRLLIESCGAVKDRSGDHIASLIGEGNQQSFLKVPASASRAALLVAVASTKLPSVTRLDAAVRAAELISAPSRPPQTRLAGLDALFGTYRDMGCPPILVEACKSYLTWSRDILPLAIPLAWLLWRENGAETSVIKYAVTSPDLGEGLPAYALDPLHTRPGKRAVEGWVRASPSLPWTPSQVASALWNYEAAACDQTLHWEEGQHLRQMAYRADLLKAGVSADDHDALMGWVQDHYPVLTEIRREAWYRIYRRPYWMDSGLERVNPPLPVPGEQKDD